MSGRNASLLFHQILHMDPMGFKEPFHVSLKKNIIQITLGIAYQDIGKMTNLLSFFTADATLVFETELVGLDKLSSFSANSIWKFINFAFWPAIILGALGLLYKRMTAAEEKIKSEKHEKKLRKKKH